jgi:4'-phosphopantetheinyl transferase EntD
MIADILPPAVAVAEEFGDVPGVRLFPAEEAVIAQAVDKRRREFTTARACARAALDKLGLPPVPIVPGPRGAPGWPAGIVGSITHCAGYRAAAVARDRDVVTIGLDAVAALATARAGTCWDRMLFSAKESVYKAWFPLTGRWLGFEEASVTFDPVRQAFTARLLVDGPMLNGARLAGFEGRWLVRDGLIGTAIVITAAGTSASCG